MKRKKIKPRRVRVLKRFMEDEIGDDEREDVVGQPNDSETNKG